MPPAPVVTFSLIELMLIHAAAELKAFACEV